MGNWEMVRLVDVCDFQGGAQPPKDEWLDTPKSGYIRMLQIRDFTQERSGKEEYVKISSTTKTCKEDDVLIARYGASLGKILRGLSGAYNVAIMKTIPNETILSKAYLYKFLCSSTFQQFIMNVSSRAAQAGFNKTDLESLEIPLPPLAIQQKIADILDHANALIEKRKTQIEKLDLLVKSRFVEMFGDPVTNPMEWKIKKLGDISSVGSSKRVFIEELVTEGIPFFRGTEISALSAGTTIKPELFITQEHYDNLRKHTGVPAIGDLLLPSICSDGQIWRVNTEEPFYFKDGRVLWIHFESEDNNKIYLRYILRSIITSNYSQLASGTTFAELKIFILKSLPVLIPPLALQTQFAAFVECVEAQKAQLKKSLALLELNYKSLMQKCFEGGLIND